MTLVALTSPIEWPASIMASESLATTTSVMDGAGEGTGFLLVAPKAGNIRKVGFLTGTVTTSETLDVRIETINASGDPSGTLWGTNTNGSQAAPASNTWYWVTLTADAVVTQGQRFMVNIQWLSTVGNLQLRNRWTNGLCTGAGVPHTTVKTSVNWSKSSIPGIVAIEYDDGTRPHCGGFPTISATCTQAIGTGSTPDEAGMYFQVPFTCKVIGVMVKVGSSAGSTYAVKLYDSDGSSVLVSVTGIDNDHMGVSGGPQRVIFGSEVTLQKDTNYRVTLLPEDAATRSVVRAVVDSAGTLQSWPGGANHYWTERTDAGAWTQDQTKVPMFALLISALDNGVSAGTNSPGASLVGGRLTR